MTTMGAGDRSRSPNESASAGPTCDRLGYKRMILDLHYGTHRPDALLDVSVDDIADHGRDQAHPIF